MNGNNLTIFAVNHNTPLLIYALNKSLRKQNPWCNSVLHIIDNSNKKELPEVHTNDFIVEYFDNNLYKPLETYAIGSKDKTLGSAHHAFTIDWFIKNRVDTDYLLLVDSDIVFTANFEKYFNEFVKNDYLLMVYKRTAYKCPTIAPWCCFANVKKIKELRLNYFDINRILYVNNNYTHDTGASLYEDAIRLNCKIKELPNNLFTQHLKCGSGSPQRHKSFLSRFKGFIL